MTSRLKKALLRLAGRTASGFPRAKDYQQTGDLVTLTHSFYGPLKLFYLDKGISHWLFDGVTVWESDIVALFETYFPKGRNIVDAGANLGLHSIALARMAQNGETIYAFEPHPEVYELTAFNCAKYRNVKCINKALSDSERSFHMQSVRHSVNAGGANLAQASRHGSHIVESVLLDKLDIQNVGLMKIDVEGHEDACIRGATETIKRDKPILIVEILGGNSRDTATPEVAKRIDQSISAVCALGYRWEKVSVHDYLFFPL